MANSVPYEQAALEQLQPHLQPGEQVLWVGKPAPESYRRLEMRRAVNSGLLLALITILAFAILVAMMLLANPVNAETIDALLMTGAAYFATSLPFVIGLPLLLSVINAGASNRILYAITNQTLVWLNTGPLLRRQGTRRFSLAKVYNVKVEHHGDETGTIVFLDAIIHSGRHTRKLSFKAIPDVDGVLAIAQEAARQAGYEDLVAETASFTEGQLLREFLQEWLCGRYVWTDAIPEMARAATPARRTAYRPSRENPTTVTSSYTAWRFFYKILRCAAKAALAAAAWGIIMLLIAGLEELTEVLAGTAAVFVLWFLLLWFVDVWYFLRRPRYRRRLQWLRASVTFAALILTLLVLASCALGWIPFSLVSWW